MTKNTSLNVRFNREIQAALKARADACGHSVNDHLRYIIDEDKEVAKPPLFDTYFYEIIYTAVATHHLVTLTGDRSDLSDLVAELKRIARGLGVHDVSQ